jgi:hypothetical protein
MVIFEPEGTYISRHILLQHWYNCPISLSMRRNPQHTSLLSVVAVNPHLRFIIWGFRTSLREFLNPVVNCFTRQTFPTVSRKYFYMNSLCIESFCSQKTQNRKLHFGITLLKQGRHFDYWNQPLNMCMRVCYVDCHETGLCCYLVMHIEKLLRPLQLFYFHLWHIYWISLFHKVTCINIDNMTNDIKVSRSTWWSE